MVFPALSKGDGITTLSLPMKIFIILSILIIVLNILFVPSQSSGGTSMIMMILLQKSSKNQSSVSNQNQFLLKKSINQAKLASSSSKQEFRKCLLETLSQLSDNEDDDEPVLAGYSQNPYADYADLKL